MFFGISSKSETIYIAVTWKLFWDGLIQSSDSRRVYYSQGSNLKSSICSAKQQKLFPLMARGNLWITLYNNIDLFPDKESSGEINTKRETITMRNYDGKLEVAGNTHVWTNGDWHQHEYIEFYDNFTRPRYYKFINFLEE